MSDKDTGSKITLSRRKALAGIGTIGTASALGLGGTYAQFTDTEEKSVTFTAGGIDGTLSWSGSYNGNEVDDDLIHVDTSGEGVDGEIHFTDIKPGDYGSVNFSIEVQNNPAWVASCIDYSNNTDYMVYEPEIKSKNESNRSELEVNVNDEGKLNETIGAADTDGELAQNLLTIPYYDSNGTSQFFDSNGVSGDLPEDFAVPSNFWSNSKSSTKPHEYLAPRTVADVADSDGALNTEVWNGGDPYECEAPDDASVGKGCVFLDGAQAKIDSSSDNTREASPLQPGNTLYFGYDFHLPFNTGNEVQGDRVDIDFGFNFLQVRHTDSPQFDSYSPGSNTPNESDS